MEQEQNLKEGIVAAVKEQLQSFKEEIVQKIDDKFGEQKKEIFEKMDGRLTEQKKEIFEKMEEGFAKQDEVIDMRFRKQGVILEDIQDKVQLLVEGQDLLHERIDRLDNRVTVLETK